MSLCISMNDGSEIRWYLGEPFPRQKPDLLPIDIVASDDELDHIFDALRLGEIERRAYGNMRSVTWNDPVAIRGIMIALMGRRNQ